MFDDLTGPQLLIREAERAVAEGRETPSLVSAAKREADVIDFAAVRSARETKGSKALH
jgi:hypothetical protein